MRINLFLRKNFFNSFTLAYDFVELPRLVLPDVFTEIQHAVLENAMGVLEGDDISHFDIFRGLDHQIIDSDPSLVTGFLGHGAPFDDSCGFQILVYSHFIPTNAKSSLISCFYLIIR